MRVVFGLTKQNSSRGPAPGRPRPHPAARIGSILLVAILAALAWAVGSGRLGRVALAIRVLDDLRRPGAGSWLQRATPAPQFERRILTEGGRRISADLYRPARGGSRTPLLFVPGLVPEGKDDPRVAPFAGLLARVGFTVVVPDLPSFRTLRAHPDNLQELRAALAAVCARPDLAPRGRAGVFGVSYAGGVAVLAALDPSLGARIPFVASVGGYADLDTTLRYLATGRQFDRGRMREVRPDAYGRLVFLKTFEEFLGSPQDRQTLEAMAERRIADPEATLDDLAPSLGSEARVLYDLFERATPDEVPSLIARLPAGLRRCMDELSPARRSFAGLRSRLYLVHARDDGTFPVTESRRIAALARPHVRVRLAVLDALQHVEPEPWRRDVRGFLTRDVPEAARLAAWWYALLGERD